MLPIRIPMKVNPDATNKNTSQKQTTPAKKKVMTIHDLQESSSGEENTCCGNENDASIDPSVVENNTPHKGCTRSFIMEQLSKLNNDMHLFGKHLKTNSNAEETPEPKDTDKELSEKQIISKDLAKVESLMRLFDTTPGLINQTINASGQPPLIVATIENNSDLVKLLLSKGADPKYADYNGLNAIDYALSNGNKKIHHMLMKRSSQSQNINNNTPDNQKSPSSAHKHFSFHHTKKMDDMKEKVDKGVQHLKEKFHKPPKM